MSKKKTLLRIRATIGPVLAGALRNAGLTWGIVAALTEGPARSNFFPRNNLGQVAEWLKAHAWKVCIRLKPYRGFESLPVRVKSEDVST